MQSKIKPIGLLKPAKLMGSCSQLLLIFVAVAFCACNKKSSLTPHEGFLEVEGGRMWYRVAGEGDKTPLLLLHGGPAYTSYYLNPLMELSKERPVIIFDQLGCGRSDRITDTTLMTVDAYIRQTKALIEHLGVDEFYLYGHSWGSMLAVDFYLEDPKGIKAMILASPCLSAKLWMADADTLISTLPDSVSVILKNNIHGIMQDSVTLQAAIDAYTNAFYTTRQPVSADIDSANAKMGTNVYLYMWGSSEFFATGTLKNYDRTRDLKKIMVPTLYITGDHDAARASTVKYYQSLTPNARLTIIPNAGHLTMQDNPTRDIKAIRTFLDELEQNR